MRHLRKIALRVAIATGVMVAFAGPARTDEEDLLRLPNRARWEPTHHLLVPRPSGLAYSNRSGLFYLCGPSPANGVSGTHLLGTTTVFMDTTGALTLPVALPPEGLLAYDARGSRLLVYDPGAHTILSIPEDEARRLEPRQWHSLAAPPLGPARVSGMSVDPSSGEVFMLDRLTRRIARFVLPPGNAPPGPSAFVEPIWIELEIDPAAELGTLAWHPGTRRFYVQADRTTVYELSEDGALLGIIDIALPFMRQPSGMVFAPSADLTDPSSNMNLFIVDPGDSLMEMGHLFEFSLEAAAPLPPAPRVAVGELLRTIETFRWSPPSPDPSGIAYDPISDRLLISDGEVEEVRIWANVNFFEATRSGTLTRGVNLTPITNEPTGVAFDPAGRMFITDDDARRIFVIQLGANRLLDALDPVTSFSSRDFGSGDPEGISYDVAGNRLFVADGVNNEIYEIHPGPDGLFNGVGDIVTSFDTGSLGVSDPETVEYNPATGTLYVIGGGRIVEATTGGSLLAVINIASVPVAKPAGMCLAPSSADPNVKSFYIVDRAVDNCSDSSENDGKVFEVAFGPSVPVPPTTAGPNYRVSNGADDAEETGGSVSLTSSDLDLEAGTIVGLRFTGMAIPSGASITNAYLQFVADESQSGATTLTIRGQRAGNATAFTSSSGNITSRPTTLASVTWNPAAWSAGNAGTAERSPSLGAILQEIVNQSGWASGNALVLVISATGKRTAESFEGLASGAPVLHVEFSTVNVAPLVEAGENQSIGFGTQAQLSGVVSDGSLPPGGSLISQWQQASGPAAVTFENPSRVDTRASFSALGSYRLRLWATDGQYQASDSMTVQVVDLPSIVVRQIAVNADDAEQSSGGSVDLASSDLDLEAGILVGLRFQNITLPRQVPIVRAYIQFTADESQSGATPLTIRAQAVDNAAPFTTASANLSSRLTTPNSVTWNPPAWTVGDSGAAQRTPDLSSIVQAVVNRDGWVSGNNLVFLFSGSGKRTAESREAGPGVAAKLLIEYQTTNRAPSVNAGPNLAAVFPAALWLDGTVSDDGLPVGSTLRTAWRRVSGPAPPTFADSNAVDTQVSFPSPGTWVLALDAYDGELMTRASISVVVNPNLAPQVMAGPDQVITLPSVAILDGTVSDSTVPSGSALTSAWRRVSGPFAVTFADSNAADTQASFAGPGTYVLSLNATDGYLSARDSITIVVHPKPNSAPQVNAGPDQTFTSPGQITLNGSVIDDGLPAGSSLLIDWRWLSGPAAPTFENRNAANTRVTLPALGTYLLSLTGSDGELARSDSVTIVVQANVAPVVNAGPDQEIRRYDVAVLDGTVSDATIPNGHTLKTAWRLVSGPGPPSFADSNAVDTQASFPDAGTYVLSLNADDGQLSARDLMTVVVRAVVAVNHAIDVRIDRGQDDAEEQTSGSVDLTSSDIELVDDAGANQTVGLRFRSVAIPPGAVITSAYVQFQVDEVDVGPTNVTVRGHKIGNAPDFTSASGNISTRARTEASAPWSPAAWSTVGAAGLAQRTPDLKAIIQEIVSQGSWLNNNALALIITGTGERTAESYNGLPAAAPLLHVEFETYEGPPPPPVNAAPQVEAGSNEEVIFPADARLQGLVTDDGLPNGTMFHEWSTVSGPAAPSFDDAGALDPVVSFPSTGSYLLELMASDGELAASDSLAIVVLPQGTSTTVFQARVAAGDDDAEEETGGSVSLTSSDLELTTDGSKVQTVGMRFTNVTIPRNATVVSAHVQFQVDEASSGSVILTVQGQRGNAASFSSSSHNVSMRPRTSAFVEWAPPAWSTVGEAGADQRTPDLKEVIQEIVDRSDWSSGHGLAIIITGFGVRKAEAFDGDASGAPLLHVEYR